MKKKKIILLSLAALLLVVAITITIILVTNKEDDDSQVIPPVIPENVVKLARPQGVKREGTVISWEAVTNATGYIIKVNDIEVITDSTSYDISNVISEGASLSVTALGENNFKNSITIKLTPYITLKNDAKILNIASKLQELYSNSIDWEDSLKASELIMKGAEELFYLGVTEDNFEVLYDFFDDVKLALKNELVSDGLELILKGLSKLNKKFENEAILTRALFAIVKNYCEVYLEVNDTDENQIDQNALLNPYYEINGVHICKDVLEYLNTIEYKTLESCQVLVGYLGKYFYTLEQQLPGIVNILVNAENKDKDFVNSDIDMLFDAFTLKDEIITTLIDDMPSYEDYMSVYNVLNKCYLECCPEFLIDASPFKLILSDLEQLYLDNHYMLSFIKYLDADFVQTVKTHITDVTNNINYEKINELRAYFETDNYLFLAMKISELACSKDGKVDYVKAANLQAFLYQLLLDLSSGDEGFITWVEELLINNLDKASQELMYEDIISDRLIDFIVSIVLLGDAPTIEDISKALELSEYFKLKDGKTNADLEAALKSITNQQIEDLSKLSFNEFSVNTVLSILGLNEILEVDVEGYIDFIKDLFTDIETFVKYLSKIDSINNVIDDINFNEALSTFIDGIGADLVAKYPVLEDSSEYLMNLLNGLGIDIPTIALKYNEIDTLLLNKEMNFKYIYKEPSINKVPVEEDYLEKLIKKYSLYVVFGYRANNIEKDIDSLVELFDYYYKLIEDNKPSKEELEEVINELSTRLDNPQNLNELLNNLVEMSEEDLNSLFEYITEKYNELFDFNNKIDYVNLENIINKIIDQLPEEYKSDVEVLVEKLFDSLLFNDFEKKMNDLQEFLNSNRIVNQEILDLYEAGMDLTNVQFENIGSYYNDFVDSIGILDNNWDNFVKEYKENQEYQTLVDNAFDVFLKESSDSFILIIDEYLKVADAVDKLPDVPTEVYDIFDSLEQIKSDINNYESFKEDVVSLIEDIYNLYK